MKTRTVRTYYKSFDIARFVCVIMIIIQAFGLPIPYFEYARPFFSIAPCILFTLYGYLVLRDDADLTYNIKHALKVFLIMFIIYGIISLGTLAYSTGSFDISSIKLILTKRNIFNFIVLSYWPTDICSSIWYVQSTLYALIFCWLFRKLKKWDWLLCIILFVIALLVGEFSGLIGFSFLGYTNLPQSFFLIRVLPFMLLGRIVYNNWENIGEWLKFHPIIFLFIGVAISAIEVFLLSYLNSLVDTSLLIGYVLVAASLCYSLAIIRSSNKEKWIDKHYPTIYKGMYYMCSPLGYIALILSSFLISDTSIVDTLYYLIGVFTLIVSFGVSLLVSVLKDTFKKYDKDPDLYET